MGYGRAATPNGPAYAATCLARGGSPSSLPFFRRATSALCHSSARCPSPATASQLFGLATSLQGSGAAGWGNSTGQQVGAATRVATPTYARFGFRSCAVAAVALPAPLVLCLTRGPGLNARDGSAVTRVCGTSSTGTRRAPPGTFTKPGRAGTGFSSATVPGRSSTVPCAAVRVAPRGVPAWATFRGTPTAFSGLTLAATWCAIGRRRTDSRCPTSGGRRRTLVRGISPTPRGASFSSVGGTSCGCRRARTATDRLAARGRWGSGTASVPATRQGSLSASVRN